MVAVLSIQSHKVRTSYRRVDSMLFDDSRRWLTALDKGMGFLASKAPMANRFESCCKCGIHLHASLCLPQTSQQRSGVMIPFSRHFKDDSPSSFTTSKFKVRSIIV